MLFSHKRLQPSQHTSVDGRLPLPCIEAGYSAMALYRWIARTNSSDLAEWSERILAGTDMTIVQDLSSDQQVFAQDPHHCGIHHNQRVKVIVSWNDRKHLEAQVEVRSEEPLLKSGTRCSIIADSIKSHSQLALSESPLVGPLHCVTVAAPLPLARGI